MATFKRVRKCVECGAVLQNDDADKIGFIDGDILNNPSYRILYCNECFQEKLKNSISVVNPEVDPDIFTVLSDAIDKKACIFYIVDLISFEDSFNTELISFLSRRSAKVYVIGLKKDLFPIKTDEEHLLDSLRRHLNRVGLIYKSATIEEAITNDGISKLIEYILKVSRKHDVYLIGSKYVGKSAIIDGFLKQYENKTGEPITTATYPDTQMRVTAIPTILGNHIYDTPGLGIQNSLLSVVETGLLRYLRPRKQLVARPFSLPYNCFIEIGGLALMFNIGTGQADLTAYFSSDVSLNRITYPRNHDYFFRSIKKNLVKPISNYIKEVADFEVFDIALEDDERMVDITILGLGFVTLKQKGQILRVYVPRGVSIGVYDSKIQLVTKSKETK